MELPPPLRRAIDRMLEGVAGSDIAIAAASLSRRYRDETPGTHVTSDHAALAYLAARLPATYAAVRASFAAVADARPDFSPIIALDVGAGPGTAIWAAADCWPALAEALLIEASPLFRAYGERLSLQAPLPPNITWRTADAAAGTIDNAPRDLVTLAYVLSELAPDTQRRLVGKLWRLTADILVIVEPGTPAGWQRILSAREVLIASGAHIVAPCPHAHACPLTPPDWCHFAQRVARSRIHRAAKNAEVPWEDEKFIYLALSRKPATRMAARVIARPRKASGRVTLKLCRPDGSAGERLISRRDGNFYKQASRLDWGDTLAE
jgi:ribosomal protein RSM22 (predicted rRNA methylase)